MKSGDLPIRRCHLRFVPTPIASQLTGLSTEKLREWTSRRALIPADIRPQGKGSPAKFSWRTILVLRVAVLLRDLFSLELQAHEAAFADLRKLLHSQSFIALWGKRLALGPNGTWAFLNDAEAAIETDALLISLPPISPSVTTLHCQVRARKGNLISLPTVHSKRRPKRETQFSNIQWRMEQT